MRKDNTALIQENTRKIDQLMADNTALMQIQNNSKQIDQLRTEIDNIKAETSPLLQLIAENSYLIEQLRFVLPGEWDVDDIYSMYGIGSCTQPCFITIQS